VPEAALYAAGLRRQLSGLLEHADRLIAISDAAAAQLRALGVPGQKLAVLPHFIPATAVASRSAAAEGRHALFAGRLVPEKGAEVAIAAARSAAVPLVIAGEGPEAERLRSLAGGAEVTFAGRVSEARLRELRAGAAVALVPSLWDEPFGYVALEALAAGVPVLVADRGGLPELAGPDAVLAAGDRTAWTSALLQLWQDPALRAARGEAGLRRARERFGEERHYGQLCRIYGWEP
jgi:glycosyltransferase involved in cell wall biosynthesis